jgi:hypothetical protein
MDDIKRLKGRMAEALVEGIFKRAQYTVARVARETQVSALMRTGSNVPDFVAWKALDEPDLGRRSYRLLAIDVEYCAQLEDRVRQVAPGRSPEVALQWPELHEIWVRRLGVRRGHPRSGHAVRPRRAAGDHGSLPLTSHEQRQGASE